MVENKKISVIIPAYNAEKTIERCLNSICKQTYNNLEIIVVNDGSVDNTELLVKKMQFQDDRIKLITIKNCGVSNARNVGIDNSTGEYITFVDSDDYVDEEMYSYLMEIIKDYNVEIAHCSYKNVDEKGNVISVVGNKERIIKQNHDEAIGCLISGKLFIGGVCNKLYNKKLFNNVRFDSSIKFNEDVLINYFLFDKADESIYIDKAYYNYVALEGSATHTANPMKSTNDCLKVAETIEKASKNKPYYFAAERRLAGCKLSLYRAYISVKGSASKKEKKQLMKEIIDYRKRGLYIRRNDKINIFLYKYAPVVFVTFYKLYDKIRVKKLDPEQ